MFICVFIGSELQLNRQTLRKTSSAKEPLRRAGIAQLLKAEKQSDTLAAQTVRQQLIPSFIKISKCHDSIELAVWFHHL